MYILFSSPISSIYEPVREKTQQFVFSTRSNTNQPVQSHKIARSFKFRVREEEDGTIHVTKTKALISFAVTAKLICVFVFSYAECCFSYAAAHI